LPNQFAKIFGVAVWGRENSKFVIAKCYMPHFDTFSAMCGAYSFIIYSKIASVVDSDLQEDP
jgi:hypothetical protein